MVLVFDYVPAGVGREQLPDAATEHPTVIWRGRQEHLICPADTIRRHVHLYHACPCLHDAEGVGQVAPSDARPVGERICGLAQESGGAFSGAKLWPHKFKLAYGRGNDRYLFDEHHHSISQDSFI